jgi:hypothetical protein
MLSFLKKNTGLCCLIVFVLLLNVWVYYTPSGNVYKEFAHGKFFGLFNLKTLPDSLAWYVFCLTFSLITTPVVIKLSQWKIEKD